MASMNRLAGSRYATRATVSSLGVLEDSDDRSRRTHSCRNCIVACGLHPYAGSQDFGGFGHSGVAWIRGLQACLSEARLTVKTLARSSKTDELDKGNGETNDGGQSSP